jgi:hypothetical protein
MMQELMKRERAPNAGHSEPVSRYVPIFVRVLIERTSDDRWQGFSLEYGLAVQGSSFADVRSRLERMIESYIHDALVGEDREHADELMSRRATGSVYWKYYLAKALAGIRFGRGGDSDSHKTFKEPLALEPRMCAP